MQALFEPHSVALVGATERSGSVGRTVLENLLAGKFAGPVYPVNPHHKELLGLRAYSSVSEIGKPIDLVVIATPAATVPEVVEDCAGAGAKGAVVISAGFRERGPEGKALEERIHPVLQRSGMRLIGPNCLGLMVPHARLNATFAADMALPGNVAFISQSGALLTAILDWSLKELVGFSAFVSAGAMLNVDWGDLIYYFADDPRTQSIVLYMESVGDPRSFLSAAREVALVKPIVVIKAGRTEAAAKAAASHTGAMTGSDEVLDAAFRRCGVLRVQHISELFSVAEVLSKQPRPSGPKLSIVTNAGGPGVLATDKLISQGGELAPLAETTRQRLDALLPPHWSHNNPVDILGDADPLRYRQTVEVVAADPATDGLLVILAPQGMTDPASAAEEVAKVKMPKRAPILASWMGGLHMQAAEEVLNRAGIPTFSYPETAAAAFVYMWQYTQNLRALYETPTLAELSDANGPANAAAIIREAALEGRTLLTEHESKRLLECYGIPTVKTLVAREENEAVEAAGEIGYPVVLKLNSVTVTHKTDVNGVQLNLNDTDEVRAAFRVIRCSVSEKVSAEAFQGVTVQPMVREKGIELILGSTPDPQFGPVLLFGAGGELVEVVRDTALGLPPLTTTLARRLIERTNISKALRGIRGRKPVELAALEQMLVRFSTLVVDQARIKEVDINPLLATNEGLIALDARVVLHPETIRDQDLPRPAIRPYPRKYASGFHMKDGSSVNIRPIRPEDEPSMAEFHHSLSERSVYLRYLETPSLPSRVAHERLSRICFIDYDRQMALVAMEAGEKIVGVGRVTKLHGRNTGEIALLVSDQAQLRGLGTELCRRLIEIARSEGLEGVQAAILPENKVMQHVATKLGMTVAPGGNGLLLGSLRLA